MSEIKINQKNKGKFTATQKRTGKSTEELCHSKNPLTRKRANFAKMAKRGWKPLKENEEYEELDPFEEYEQGYPNDNFDVSDMTPEKLAKWCRNVGDFLYVYKGLRGLSIMVANVDEIVYDIVKDLYDCDRIEPTHEVDYLFSSREREFENDYVCIFKVIGTKDGDYYIVYQEDKWDRGNFDLDESKQTINETFKSNELRNWFKLHGGVKKVLEDFSRNERDMDNMYNLKRIIKESVISVLREQSFNEQWEEEIKIFFDGLENGEALVDGGYVAVEWGNSENDPRFIYYKEGEDCLTDNHFSIQHSRKLYWDEISKIRDCAKYMYGVDIYIPDDEYWDEVNDY